MFISIEVICSLIGIKEHNLLKSSPHSVHLEAEKRLEESKRQAGTKPPYCSFLPTLF
jgi:hypothetical protein